MPTPLYTNASLADRERQRKQEAIDAMPLAPDVLRGHNVSQEYTGPEASRDSGFGNLDQRVALDEARASLDESSDYPLSNAGTIEDRLAALSQPRHGLAREITDGLEWMAAPAAAAALVPSPAQPLAVGLAATGYGLSGLRKAVMPEPDESRLGGAVEAGLSALPLIGHLRGAVAPAAEILSPEAEVVREVVNTAKGYRQGGASAKQAASRAGWPLGKSSEIPYQAETQVPTSTELFPYQKDALAGLRQAAQKPARTSPIKQFYEVNPQARGMAFGEFAPGRTTGSFVEGEGGLRNPNPPHRSPTEGIDPVTVDLTAEVDALAGKKTPSSLRGLRATLANTRPIEGDNPVVSRTLNEIRAEMAALDSTDVAGMERLQRAERQAQMLRRKKGGGR